MEGPEVRVLLASNDNDERVLLRRTLELEPAIRVVDEARDASEALRLHGVHRPDVTVVDFGLPDANGLEVIRQLVARQPGTLAFLLTSRAFKCEYQRAAVLAGAQGVLLKPFEIGKLAVEIRGFYVRPRRPPHVLRDGA